MTETKTESLTEIDEETRLMYLKHYEKSSVRLLIKSYCRGRLVSIVIPRINAIKRYNRGGFRDGKALVFKDMEHELAYTPHSLFATVCKFFDNTNIIENKNDKTHEKEVLSMDIVVDIDPRHKSKENMPENLSMLTDICRQFEKIIAGKFHFWWLFTGSGIHFHINAETISTDILEKYGFAEIAHVVGSYLISNTNQDSEKVTFQIMNRFDSVVTIPLSPYRKPVINRCIATPFKSIDNFDFHSANIEKFDWHNISPTKTWLENKPALPLDLFEEMRKSVPAFEAPKNHTLSSSFVTKKFGNRQLKKLLSRPCIFNALTKPLTIGQLRCNTLIVFALRHFDISSENIFKILQKRNGQTIEKTGIKDVDKILDIVQPYEKTITNDELNESFDKPSACTDYDVPCCEKMRENGGQFMKKLSFGDVGLCEPERCELNNSEAVK